MKKREIDQKKEEDQKIERRMENAAKEISHKLTTLVQTEAVRVMTDTEITKEIRKKVIKIEIEIRVLILAAGALAEIEKEIETVIKIGDMITKLTEIRSEMKEI